MALVMLEMSATALASNFDIYLMNSSYAHHGIGGTLSRMLAVDAFDKLPLILIFLPQQIMIDFISKSMNPILLGISHDHLISPNTDCLLAHDIAGLNVSNMIDRSNLHHTTMLVLTCQYMVSGDSDLACRCP